MPTLDEIVARADKVHGYMFPRELRWLCGDGARPSRHSELATDPQAGRSPLELLPQFQQVPETSLWYARVA